MVWGRECDTVEDAISSLLVGGPSRDGHFEKRPEAEREPLIGMLMTMGVCLHSERAASEGKERDVTCLLANKMQIAPPTLLPGFTVGFTRTVLTQQTIGSSCHDEAEESHKPRIGSLSSGKTFSAGDPFGSIMHPTWRRE